MVSSMFVFSSSTFYESINMFLHHVLFRSLPPLQACHQEFFVLQTCVVLYQSPPPIDHKDLFSFTNSITFLAGVIAGHLLVILLGNTTMV